MASGLNRWVGAWVVGAILICTWAIPPRSPDEWPPEWTGRGVVLEETPFHRAYIKITEAARIQSDLWQYRRWGDSLAVAARASSEEGAGWFSAAPDWETTGYAGDLEEAIERELGGRPPLVPVGAVVMADTIGRHPEVSKYSGISGGWRLMASLDPAGPYCVIVDPAHGPPSDPERLRHSFSWTGPDSAVISNPLGPCALHARYGNPGPPIFDWLRSVGYSFAEGSLGYWVRRYGRRMEPTFLREFDQAAPWARNRPERELSLQGRRCVLGITEGCRAAFLRPRVRLQSNLSHYGNDLSPLLTQTPLAYDRHLGTWTPRFSGAEGTILFELEEEFGPDRFQAFWTSDQDVEDAFQAAFGIPAETWLMNWAQSRFSALVDHPRVPAGTSLLSLLTAALFLGLALVTGRRIRP